MNDKFDKWKKWLEVIYHEIIGLSENRYVYQRVSKIVEDNPKIQKPSLFYEFLTRSYAVLMLMGIRRQIKADKESISFARLLDEICKNPEVISREDFVALYKGSDVEYRASQDFDQFAGEGSPYVDPQIVSKDIEDLKAKAQKCEECADKIVAHTDEKKPSSLPTYEDVDVCLDLLQGLLQKYWLLFTGEMLCEFVPIPQFDWTVIFKEPWIPENSALAEENF